MLIKLYVTVVVTTKSNLWCRQVPRIWLQVDTDDSKLQLSRTSQGSSESATSSLAQAFAEWPENYFQPDEGVCKPPVRERHRTRGMAAFSDRYVPIPKCRKHVLQLGQLAALIAQGVDRLRIEGVVSQLWYISMIDSLLFQQSLQWLVCEGIFGCWLRLRVRRWLRGRSSWREAVAIVLWAVIYFSCNRLLDTLVESEIDNLDSVCHLCKVRTW